MQDPEFTVFALGSLFITALAGPLCVALTYHVLSKNRSTTLQSKQHDHAHALAEVSSRLDATWAYHNATQTALRSRREEVVREFDEAYVRWTKMFQTIRREHTSDVDVFLEQLDSSVSPLKRAARRARFVMPSSVMASINEIAGFADDANRCLALLKKAHITREQLHTVQEPDAWEDTDSLSIEELEYMAEATKGRLKRASDLFLASSVLVRESTEAGLELKRFIEQDLDPLQDRWTNAARAMLGADSGLPHPVIQVETHSSDFKASHLP